MYFLEMRKKLALFCFRVARWLAPDYFSNRLQSIHEMRMRIEVLRKRLTDMRYRERRGIEYDFIISELQCLEALLQSAIQHTGSKFEMLKIEILRPEKLSQMGWTRVANGEDKVKVVADEIKKQLFESVAAGLSKSTEIEKFMYHHDRGEFKTVGIRLYLKHD